MKKNLLLIFSWKYSQKINELKRIGRIMKITIALILIALFPIKAVNILSQNALVNITKNSISIEELINSVESQTNYLFLYSEKEVDLSKKVRVSGNSKPVSEVLNQAFSNTDIIYSFNEDYISLRKKAELSSSPVSQQSKKIVTGSIIDENKDPVAGASIVEKGTTNGITTDADGKFSLNVEENAILQISYIGYFSQEISVKNQWSITITLSENLQALEEVVVVGYGTQRKTSLTGSIVAVKGTDIVKSPAMNVLNSMNGRLPGLIINSRSGEPGRDTPEIFIRGRGTTGNNAPLYIIDGVEREGLGQINPSDIESISVLKDAEAAIYGARSANGVILVTTKRGNEGKPTISLSFDQAFTQPTRNSKMGDAYTFAKVWNETQEYNQHFYGTPPPSLFSQEALEKYKNGTDPYYPNTDWYDYFMKDITPQHRTNASISGGAERVKYFISFGEAMQDGHFNHGITKVRQYNVRSNLDVKITDWLKVKVDLAVRKDKKKYPHWGTFDAYSHLVLYQPVWQPYWPGTDFLYPCRDGDNLINLIGDAGGTENQNYENLFSKFEVTIDMPWIKGLSLDAGFSFDSKQEFSKRFQKPTYVYQRDAATDTYTEVRSNRGVDKAELNDWYNRGNQNYFVSKINYNRTFGDHNINILAGYEQTQSTGNRLEGGTKDFISTTLPELDMGSRDKEKWTLNGFASQNASQSFFGRTSYNYRSKYMAQFTFRYDGSTIFPSNKRFGFFPSASAAWRISEEDFMKDFTYINNMKIRGSYGEMGNDRVAAFQYMTFYGAGNNYVIDGKEESGLIQNNVPNPIITWETAKTMNIGFETTMWNGFLGIEFDYFNSKRSNILRQRNAIYPEYSGIKLPQENFGKVNNKGFEAIVSHSNYKNDIKYSISANMSYVRNKIIDIDEAPAAEPYQMATGRPINSGLYYKYLGVFQNQEQLDNYPAMAGFGIGDPIYEDVNKDGIVDSKDRIRLDHNITPEITYGLNATIAYKDFDLSVLLQGQENAAKNLSAHFAKLNYTWGNFYEYVAEDRWSLDNPTGTKPRANTQDRGTSSSTLWYTDAGFLRLKNLEMGYNLPSSLCEKLKINTMRVYISGNNLFLIYDHMKKWGFDPEVDSYFGGYTIQRTYNIGINIVF